MRVTKNIICATIYILIAPHLCFSSSENLDELDARKARIKSAIWSNAFLENPITNVWQPESLIYNDVITGHEVQRLTSSNSRYHTLPDISWSHYSADGKKFSFGTPRVSSAAGLTSISRVNNDSNSTRAGMLMISHTDGSNLRPTVGSKLRCNYNNRYTHWDPTIPDVFYTPSGNSCGEGGLSTQLYKITVGTQSVTSDLLLTAPTGMTLKKSISGDGKKILAHSGSSLIPISINGSTAVLDDVDGWSLVRPLDTFWGNTPALYSSFHDEFLRGTGSNIKLYMMPGSATSWWRYALSGTATDGGPTLVVDNAEPYDWGSSIEPVLTGNGSGGLCNPLYRSPWNCDTDTNTGEEQYMSHPGFDKWGRYVCGSNSQQHQAWGVLEIATGIWKNHQISAPHFDWHTSWDAWSDHFVASPSGIHEDQFIYSPKYDGTDTIQVANSHIRESGTTAYNALPRAVQSPDGTKVMYHTDMFYPAATASYVAKVSGGMLTVLDVTSGAVNIGDLIHGTNIIPDMHVSAFGTGTGGVGTYILDQTNPNTVNPSSLHDTDSSSVYYGKIVGSTLTVYEMVSGTIANGDAVLSGSTTKGTITSFGTGTGGAGTYNLSGAVAHDPTNIKNGSNGYDLMSAVAYYPHAPEITSVTNSSGTYTIQFDWRLGTETPRGYTERGWPDETNNRPPPPRETRLFRLWRSSTGAVGSWEPVAETPANIFSRYNFATGAWPGNDYWTINDTPGDGTFYYAVTSQEWSGLESLALSNVFSTAGVQTTAYPADPGGKVPFTSGFKEGVIRAWNVYASDAGTPAAVQQNRIATIPTASPKEYIDWLANATATTHYTVTALDSQGFESAPLTITVTPSLSGVAGRNKITWTSEVDPTPDPVCGDAGSPGLCTTEGDCTAVGFNWCSGVCQIDACPVLPSGAYPAYIIPGAGAVSVDGKIGVTN